MWEFRGQQRKIKGRYQALTRRQAVRAGSGKESGPGTGEV